MRFPPARPQRQQQTRGEYQAAAGQSSSSKIPDPSRASATTGDVGGSRRPTAKISAGMPPIKYPICDPSHACELHLGGAEVRRPGRALSESPPCRLSACVAALYLAPLMLPRLMSASRRVQNIPREAARVRPANILLEVGDVGRTGDREKRGDPQRQHPGQGPNWRHAASGFPGQSGRSLSTNSRFGCNGGRVRIGAIARRMSVGRKAGHVRHTPGQEAARPAD